MSLLDIILHPPLHPILPFFCPQSLAFVLFARCFGQVLGLVSPRSLPFASPRLSFHRHRAPLPSGHSSFHLTPDILILAIPVSSETSQPWTFVRLCLRLPST
ncbi:hypothetical protein ACQY0O_005377 [Thecaphora frezii]